jgi:hypothetical protein
MMNSVTNTSSSRTICKTHDEKDHLMAAKQRDEEEQMVQQGGHEDEGGYEVIALYRM